MYKEFAFDPRCFHDFSYYTLIKTGFGFEFGRYISADTKSWVREAVAVVKQSDIKEVRKKSITNFLNKLQKDKKGKLLIKNRATADADSWVDWWRKEVAIKPFSATISEDEPGQLTLDDITDENSRWVVKNSEECEKNENAIFDLVSPLLSISKTILIVDPYYKFAANKSLARLICGCQPLSNISSITIVSSIETDSPDKVYKNGYERLNTRGIKLQLIHVDDKYFHDRYLITDKGALKSGQGFSEDIEKGTHADKLRLGLIAQEESDGVKASLKKALDNGKAREIFCFPILIR